MNEDLLQTSRALNLLSRFCKNLEGTAHYNYFLTANSQVQDKKALLEHLDRAALLEQEGLVRMCVKARDYLGIIIDDLSSKQEVTKRSNG